MKDSVPYGVSANLCDALFQLALCGGGKGVDFNFSWAPSRGIPAGAPTHLSIPLDLIPILEETSRISRANSNIVEVEVLGTVRKFEHQNDQSGKVTIGGHPWMGLRAR